jgi:hypothetical protein
LRGVFQSDAEIAQSGADEVGEVKKFSLAQLVANFHEQLQQVFAEGIVQPLGRF